MQRPPVVDFDLQLPELSSETGKNPKQTVTADVDVALACVNQTKRAERGHTTELHPFELSGFHILIIQICPDPTSQIAFWSTTIEQQKYDPKESCYCL